MNGLSGELGVICSELTALAMHDLDLDLTRCGYDCVRAL